MNAFNARQTYLIEHAWLLGSTHGLAGCGNMPAFADLSPSERCLARCAFLASRDAMLKFTQEFEGVIRDATTQGDRDSAGRCHGPECPCRGTMESHNDARGDGGGRP